MADLQQTKITEIVLYLKGWAVAKWLRKGTSAERQKFKPDVTKTEH